jgi:hypothetical protein
MQRLLEVFHKIITLEGAIEQSVKGQSLMCAGRLAAACGKDQFPTQAVDVFTKFGLECLKADNKYELRETAMTYFSDLSTLLKEDIAPVFDQVLNEIIKSMNAEDEIDGEENGPETKKSKGFSLDSDSEECDEEGYDVNINQIDEKASAINSLGIICQNAPRLCANRRKDILDALEKNHQYFHENIKFHVTTAYTQIVHGMITSSGVRNSDDLFDWTKGPAAGQPLPQDVM